MALSSITAANLRSRIREAANMENSELVSDTEMDQWISTAIADYDEEINQIDPSFNLRTNSFTTDSSGAVDLSVSGSFQVNKILNVYSQSGSSLYRIDKLDLYEREMVEPEGAGVAIVADYFLETGALGASFSFLRPGDEYVIYAVAAKMLDKEQNDNSFQVSVAQGAIRSLQEKAQRPVLDGMDFPDDRPISNLGFRSGQPRRKWMLRGFDSLEIFRYRDNLWGG